MRSLIIFSIILLFANSTDAQNNIGIGTDTPDNSALLEIKSNTKGVLLPRMFKSERLAIASPAEGLIVHQTDDTTGLYQYQLGVWKPVSDNLGNHNMTQNLVTNTKRIVNYSWQRSGIEIDDNGNTNIYGYRPFPWSGSNPVKNVIIDNTGGIYSQTEVGYGYRPLNFFPPSGAHLMWYPYYGSFRAGGVMDNCWSDDQMGFYSAVFGYFNIASENFTFAAGSTNRVEGAYSASFGRNNVIKTGTSFVIGKYNDTTATTPLFTVGNGTANASRSNAFIVLNDGKTGIGNINPEYMLDVNGRMSLRHNGNSAGIWYSNSSNVETGFAGMKTDNQWGVFGGGWKFYFDFSDGQAYKASGSTAWIVASDLRLKESVRPYTDGIKEIMKINPVWFNYKQNSGYISTQPYVGVIAQDLQKTAPYMVGSFKKDDQELLNVDNSSMTYMLINAVKEQQAEIELLKKENQEIKAIIKSLR
ncbi:tail fiber domain-containing protein [Ferruginibacter sp. SUN002]|uniref:tail fiber domain-containing protein n=1 Tax=Ferruginibacter sp. SUN002 TaxID=2937789 RepID=UPI003D3626A7